MKPSKFNHCSNHVPLAYLLQSLPLGQTLFPEIQRSNPTSQAGFRSHLPLRTDLPAVILFRARPHIQSAKLWNLAFNKGPLEDKAFLTLPALMSPVYPLPNLCLSPSSPKAGALEIQPVPLGQRFSNMMVPKNY